MEQETKTIEGMTEIDAIRWCQQHKCEVAFWFDKVTVKVPTSPFICIAGRTLIDAVLGARAKLERLQAADDFDHYGEKR